MNPAADALATAAPNCVPALARHQDPVWLVESVRGVYSLPRLQAVTRKTIARLQALAPAQLLGQDGAPSARRAQLPDPISEALRACSAELRQACGIAGSQVALMAHANLVRRYAAQQPPAWGTTFGAALESYRQAACAALLRGLDYEAMSA
jgi:hypothetical protein